MVSFDWKAKNTADLGLVAEEVNAIEPLLTTTNDKGEVEGVKYDRVGVVLVNAVNEQQMMIESQQKMIETLKTQVDSQQKTNEAQMQVIEALRLTVCQTTPSAPVCKQ